MTLTQLKYGLAYTASGVTLAFTLSAGVHWYITQGHVAELLQATIERSLAADQPAPNIVEIWPENGTNYTVTNAIGWYPSMAQVTSIAAHVRGLVPYYLDTQTMANHTVTGLWASLQVGDRTNRFTLEVSPTWVPRQSDLLEIYSVLQRLRTIKMEYAVSADRYSSQDTVAEGENAVWVNATTQAEAAVSPSSPSTPGASFFTIASGATPTNGGSYQAQINAKIIKPRVQVVWDPDLYADVRLLIYLQKPSSALGLYYTTSGVFDAYGTGFTEGWNQYDYVASVTGSYYLVSTGYLGRMPSYPADPLDWCDTPSASTGTGAYAGVTAYVSTRGFQSLATSNLVLLSWRFLYCTNPVTP